jgi:hypothetical protein
MSEAELVEASATYNELMQGWISAYFTAFTAFIITSYFVGRRLTKTQAVFISGGFFLFSALCTFAAFGTGSSLVDFANEAEAINPERNFLANDPTIYAGTIVLAIGILISLKFMWDVKHARGE